MGKKVLNIMKPERRLNLVMEFRKLVVFFFLIIIYDPLANDPVLSWQK